MSKHLTDLLVTPAIRQRVEALMDPENPRLPPGATYAQGIVPVPQDWGHELDSLMQMQKALRAEIAGEMVTRTQREDEFAPPVTFTKEDEELARAEAEERQRVDAALEEPWTRLGAMDGRKYRPAQSPAIAAIDRRIMVLSADLDFVTRAIAVMEERVLARNDQIDESAERDEFEEERFRKEQEKREREFLDFQARRRAAPFAPSEVVPKVRVGGDVVTAADGSELR